MSESTDDREGHLGRVKLQLDHIARVTRNFGPEVVKALNDSVPFLEDYFRREGAVSEVPYVPRNQQGNQRFTASSTDPEVVSALRRSALSLAQSVRLHVPSLAEARQSFDD